jgi:peptide/nickel transport system permease protein
MSTYILKRIAWLIPVLFAVSVIVFSIVHLIPGDPATVLLGTEAADPELLESMRRALGLDQPLHVQYVLWLQRIFQGDFGASVTTGRPVLRLILERFPYTVELALYALVLAVVLAIPFGTLVAVTNSQTLQLGFQGFTLLGLSVPQFWSGVMFILLFSVHLGWFPIVNFPAFTEDPWGNLRAFFLPALTLALPNAAAIARVVRASVLEVSQQDYVLTARSKGLRERTVVFKHMLKNAMIPIITLVGIIAGYLLGGVIVVEKVFAIPGLGRLGVDAIVQRDYPVLQGTVLFVVVMFVLVNLIVDVLYVFLNPKIRYG